MRHRVEVVAVWLGLAVLAAGCASHAPAPPEEPTLASLAGRQPTIDTAPRAQARPEQAIAAYRRFLQGLPKDAGGPERAEALRRLADLELDRVDAALASAAEPGRAADLRAAIGAYQTYLQAYPEAKDHHRVLYQLARAQELGGDIEASLATLTRLVGQHAASPHAAEAQFRRGELLFSAGRHAEAEAAFGAVLTAPAETLFHERALYMQGWARFKRGRLDDALASFLALLDRRLGGVEPGTRPALSRADRELLEDSFRVTSLCLQNLQGADSLPAVTEAPQRRAYEPRLYTELAALYLKHERVKDAADTLAAFARRRPLHAQAPVLLSQVIGIHERAGFATLALQAKRDFVTRYGAASEFRSANPEGWRQAQPLVKSHLTELARHHHARAQAEQQPEDRLEAARWYRALLEAFPDDADAPEHRFLLAELLFEQQRWAEAANEYAQVAYGAPGHARAAEAGYAVLLAHARQAPPAGQAGATAAWRRQGVTQGLRFADTFAADPRAAAVLTDAADQLFALNDGEAAASVARRVLALQPPPSADQRRVAWTVLAHTRFDSGAFAEAEQAYRELLALGPADAAAREMLTGRLAAAVYKQGETARADGRLGDAAGHFERAAAIDGGGAVQAAALYDAGAARIVLEDWAGAARTLEDFRRRHPGHALNAELPVKLAAAYLALSAWGPAALELERLAAGAAEPAAARDALWQAAELHARAGDRRAAMRVYELYLQRHPRPLETAVTAHQRLATMAREAGDHRAATAWTGALLEVEAAGGDERTAATRQLGARAALEAAEPLFEAFRQVRLSAPLARTLALKKARLDSALQACARLSDYGVAEAVTAAAFHSAALYQDFGRALLASERPRKLKQAELEQYNVMLEEQAFPFEEKAIELHAVNARWAADGLYDEWVRRSFAALAQLQPARWARAERGASPRSLAEQEAQAPRDAAGWTALGVARREQGRFADADAAYAAALALQPAHADALLNRAILHELYLGDRAQALALYQGYLALQAGDAAVTRWVAALQRELGAAAGRPVAVNRKEAP